jgi:pyruvate/2-oxoglutarate dehydrogenase complex dihydrolipoamide acyltransferase (E2) component
VVDDRIEPRPVLRLCAAFDHRVIDGFSAGKLSSEVEHLLSNPSELLDTDEEKTG